MKTNIIKFSPLHFFQSQLITEHSNTTISEVPDTRFLGVQIDSHLTWKCHIDQILQKLSTAGFVIAMNNRDKILFFCFWTCWFFWLIYCMCDWIILKGSEHVLVSLCSHGGVHEKFVSILGWITPNDFSPGLVARPEGGVRHSARWQKTLQYTVGGSMLFRLCLSYMIESCTPLWPQDDFYKWE